MCIFNLHIIQFQTIQFECLRIENLKSFRESVEDLKQYDKHAAINYEITKCESFHFTYIFHFICFLLFCLYSNPSTIHNSCSSVHLFDFHISKNSLKHNLIPLIIGGQINLYPSKHTHTQTDGSRI